MNDEKEVQVLAPEQDLSDVPEVIKEHWHNIKKLSPGELITWEELTLQKTNVTTDNTTNIC